jgi:hypothetical protein
MTFKLPNFLNLGELNALRFQMRAPLSKSFESKTFYRPIDLPVVERLRAGGIDVKFDDVKVLDDGTLAYKGYRVLLYIRDIASYGDRQAMPKFHLSYCRTLETMRINNRFQRYVVANRDDGVFSVNLIQETIRAEMVKLSICQNCLAKTRWHGFRNDMDKAERAEFVRGFKLKEFFEKYPRDLLTVKPNHNSDNSPVNDYTGDWGDISERVKNVRGYRCEGAHCGIRLTARESKYLHVHHENGLKYDNSERNLTVLCVRCHANQPMHGHMKNMPDYLNFIARYG